MSEVVMRAVNLFKTYKLGSQEVRAVDGISLSVEKGELVSIIGTSGSGKSTLLHLLGGLDKPTSGEVYLEETRIDNLNDKALSLLRRRRIGFVFQKFCLIQELNLVENIVLPVLLDGRKPDYDRLDDICEMLGLSDRKCHLPSQLSGGQQQRVSIARALMAEPDVILCDEPTGNLDKNSSKDVVELLCKANEKFGTTILIVTHDVNVADRAGRKIQIEDGHII